jgi:hypothetical protein
MTAGELAAAVGANEALAAERSRSVADPTSNTLYMATMFSLDAGVATALLFERLEGLSDPAQAALVQRVLPRVFGGEFGNDEDAVEHVPLPSLERLVRLAFQTIRQQDDIVHRSGEVYSPGPRDDAEHARGAVFERLVTTPGRAGFDAIMRLHADDKFPVPKARMQELAIERASLDAESAFFHGMRRISLDAAGRSSGKEQSPRSCLRSASTA